MFHLNLAVKGLMIEDRSILESPFLGGFCHSSATNKLPLKGHRNSNDLDSYEPLHIQPEFL